MIYIAVVKSRGALVEYIENTVSTPEAQKAMTKKTEGSDKLVYIMAIILTIMKQKVIHWPLGA